MWRLLRKRPPPPRGDGRMRMHPERYAETFFATTCARLNFAARLAARRAHFEAARFLRDLFDFADELRRPPPRRA